jgi:hypothetical protein
MPRTYVSVEKRDLVEVLFRIANNERIGAQTRVKSIDLITRLKGYRMDPPKRNQRRPVPKKPVVAPEPIEAPSPLLLGLKKQ